MIYPQKYYLPDIKNTTGEKQNKKIPRWIHHLETSLITKGNIRPAFEYL